MIGNSWLMTASVPVQGGLLVTECAYVRPDGRGYVRCVRVGMHVHG